MTARAGMAHSRIEVPAGLVMDGYRRRRSPATGTRDPLEATALYVADDHGAVVVVSLDLVAVSSELVRLLRRRICQEVDVTGTLIAATHTHAGPAGVRVTSGGTVIDAVVDAVRNSVGRAATSAVPVLAQLGTSQLPATVATNRNDPQAPIDRRITLIRLSGGDGSPVGSLWHTGVHPTVLGPDNLHYSADLPGEVRRRLRRGEESVMFLNGSAGDVSSRFARRGRDSAELERLGGLLGRALPLADRPIELSPIAAAERLVTLEPANHDDQQTAQLWQRTTHELASEELTAGERRRLESVLEGIGRLNAEPLRRSRVEALVQVLRLGDLVLAGIPGEAVSALSFLRADQPDETLLLVGYANGYIGYLTADADKPTYETLVSRVASGAGERLVMVADELARATFDG